jgi:Na+-transporting NADH:ubiquinone oxidoreductase subunit NqrD
VKLPIVDVENVIYRVSAEDTSMKRSSWHLLVVGVALNCLGFVLSALWTAWVDRPYFIRGIGLGVGLSILLVLVAMNGRRWAVYVLAGISLVSSVAHAATLEPRRLIVSALELGAATAFVAYIAQTRSDQTQART